jgi:hypothetical protein
MPNMSYCRFSNTLTDLRECYDALGNGPKPESEAENKACDRLLLLCADIAADFEGEIEELREKKARK